MSAQTCAGLQEPEKHGFLPMLKRLAEPSTANAVLFLTLTMLFWAGNFTLGRWASAVIPPFTLTALRWTGAAAIALLLARPYLARDWPLVRAHTGILVLLGVMGSGSFNALQYLALGSTTATNAGIINSTSPAMIVIASYLISGEPVTRKRLAGILVSFAGVLVMLTKGEAQRLASLDFNRGDVILLGAMALWSIYTALLPRRPPIHGMSFVALSFAIAAAMNIPVAIIEQALGATTVWTTPTFMAIAYTAVFPSVIAYFMFNRGVEIIGPARAGAFMHLVPLFTAILAMIFLGEQVAAYHAAALVLILAGVALAAG